MRWSLLVATFTFTLPVLATDPPAEKPKAKPVDVPFSKPADQFRIVGKLGVPFGEVVIVQGVVVEGPFKGWEGGPNLRVQRVGGRATQEDIQIKLRGDFEKKRESKLEMPKAEVGKSYEFEGYETGGFVGIPWEAYQRQGLMIQTSGHHFRHELIVYTGKTLDPIVWSPADFADREALLEGKAVSRDKKAYIDGNGWKLLTDPAAVWPKEFEGKTVEGFGTMKKTDGEYRLAKGVTRLVTLEDQKGRAVELRGTAWSMNGHWWFNYRGTDLYVEDMDKLPGWKVGLHGEAVIITGTLDEADMPDIGRLTIDISPPKKKYFVVRKAGWKPLDALLAPERVERK